MSNGGKGDDRRPLSVDEATFASTWDRIFGSNKLMGTSSIGRAAGSNPAAPSPACAGSTPAFPAIYIDNATGQEVSEDWWPGDPIVA